MYGAGNDTGRGQSGDAGVNGAYWLVEDRRSRPGLEITQPLGFFQGDQPGGTAFQQDREFAPVGEGEVGPPRKAVW